MAGLYRLLSNAIRIALRPKGFHNELSFLESWGGLMGMQRFHCAECNEPHEAEIWYSRQHISGNPEYLCDVQFKRADLDSGWEPHPVSD